jgi:hypothetical protein
VPIPNIIEELYGARYDWQMAPLAEKAKMKARYDELIAQAAKAYGRTERVLWLAVRDNYHVWRRQNQLPKPPSPGNG